MLNQALREMSKIDVSVVSAVFKHEFAQPSVSKPDVVGSSYDDILRFIKDCRGRGLSESHIQDQLIPMATIGCLEGVQALLAAGADPNIKGEYGATALIWAADEGHVACVQALLDAGANPNIKDKGGCTALYLAAINGRADCVKALLQGGANPNGSGEWADTALLWAASKGHTACVEALLPYMSRDAIHVQDVAGETALHKAAIEGHAVCIKALLKAGADPALLEHNLCCTALHQAAMEGHAVCVKALIEGGADPNFVNKWREDALHFAAINGRADCVRALIEGGADPNLVNRWRDELHNGATALHWAVLKGHVDCVRALLEAGADLNLVNRWSEGVLHLAASNGRLECVKALLPYMSREAIHAKNGDGQTALQISQQKDLAEVERWLNSADQIQAALAAIQTRRACSATLSIEIQEAESDQASDAEGVLKWKDALVQYVLKIELPPEAENEGDVAQRTYSLPCIYLPYSVQSALIHQLYQSYALEKGQLSFRVSGAQVCSVKLGLNNVQSQGRERLLKMLFARHPDRYQTSASKVGHGEHTTLTVVPDVGVQQKNAYQRSEISFIALPDEVIAKVIRAVVSKGKPMFEQLCKMQKIIGRLCCVSRLLRGGLSGITIAAPPLPQTQTAAGVVAPEKPAAVSAARRVARLPKSVAAPRSGITPLLNMRHHSA